MYNKGISIDYDPEGDILYVTFGAKGRKGKGYELNDHIYIRIDLDDNEPLGLTILDYKKILTQEKFELSFWDELKLQERDLLRVIINKEPVNHFLQLKEIMASMPIGILGNPSLQEILAA